MHAPSDMTEPSADVFATAREYHKRLVDDDLLRHSLAQLPDEQKRARVSEALEHLFWQDRLIVPEAQKARIRQFVIDEMVGFGPLAPLLGDPEVTEIMVLRPDEVRYERDGRIFPAKGIRFTDAAHVMHLIDRMIAPLGRRVDEASPLVDARLPDGSRVHVAVPPVALHGPSITIRKFRPSPWTLQDLTERGAMSPDMSAFLRLAVGARCNLIISGGTGSGKTSLLSALVDEIPEDERLVTIEDMAELRFQRRNVVALEGRPPNLEGSGEITIRTLVRNALRMRPDRIIVGETRGEEAFDVIQAMNTGHPGSLVTLHANSPTDALGRLEQMILMAGTAMTLEAIRSHIAGTLHLVVQLQRMPDGRRRITEIGEIAGIRGSHVDIQPLFRLGADACLWQFQKVAEPKAVAPLLAQVTGKDTPV